MSEELEIFVRKASGLVREVGILPTIAICFAFTVPGIFFLPFEATYFYPGCNAPMAWGVASLLMVWSALALTFLTVCMPRAAADYVGLTRALSPVLGYIGSWINCIALALLIGIVPYWGVMLTGNFFTIVGAITGNPYYLGIGEMLFEPNIILGISIIVILIAMVISLLGMRAYRIIMNIIFIVPLIAMIIGVGATIWYASLGPAAVKAAWDAVFGAGAWDEIVTIATNNGWSEYITSATGSPEIFGFPGGWAWGATFLAIVPAAFSCWGYESAIFVAGEIKKARRVIPLGVITAYILLTAFYVAMVYFVHVDYGNFLSMYAFVIEGGYADQLVINIPTFPGWDIFSSTLATASFGPVLGAFAAIPGGWTNIAWSLVGLLLTSRILFAWSFDRFAPEFISRVNDRFHTPHWSIVIAAIVGIIGAAYTVFHPYFAMVSMFNGAVIRYLFACWAALLLPYMKPDIFRMGFTWKVGPIPLITIIGAIGTITTSWLFITFLVILAGDWASIYWQVIALATGAIVFAIFYAYNKAKGIDVEALWRTIPPS